MPTTTRFRVACMLAASWLIAAAGAPARAGSATASKAVSADAATTALLAEVRKSFTVHRAPIPPEIFRDMGDGDMADSGNIWVTVDVAAATGSNLYYDPITQDHGWVSQNKARGQGNDGEETGYHFVGAADNGLLVVVAAWSGGGSGDFYTLHILDAVAAHGFDADGKPYARIDLTVVRSVPLGDRWGGDIKIAKNTITITKPGPGVGEDAGKRPTLTITAARP